MSDAQKPVGLPRKSRLKSKKAIADLFATGSYKTKFPLGVVYKKLSISEQAAGNTQFQVAFTVPKKRIKSAVKRNLLKRRMREAFRINQFSLAPSFSKNDTDIKLHLMFIYQHKSIVSYSAIEKAMRTLLQMLKAEAI